MPDYRDDQILPKQQVNAVHLTLAPVPTDSPEKKLESPGVVLPTDYLIIMYARLNNYLF